MLVSKYNINNLNIYHIPTAKFKTIILGLVFTCPLTDKFLPEKILLATLLNKTCSKFPNEQDYLKYLKELYDTNIFGDVSKRGKTLQLMFVANIINPEFINIDKDLFNIALESLKNNILCPNFENDNFSENLLTKEKNLLKDEINAQTNNIKMVAVAHLIEKMFEHETYKLYSGLKVEDVERITVKSLKKAYIDLLNSSCYGIVIGKIDKEKCIEGFKRFKILQSFNNCFEYIDYETKKITNISELSLEKYSNQSVMVIGIRTEIHVLDELYYPMVVMNGMFGGFFHSSLVQEIREKAKLSYYISSEYISQKGFLAITTGINKKDYVLVKKIIEQLLLEYQKGNFSVENMNMTKEILINNIIESNDSQVGMLNDIYRVVEYSDNLLTFEERINKIRSVTKEQIISCANLLQIDTIFLLKGTKEDEEIL